MSDIQLLNDDLKTLSVGGALERRPEDEQPADHPAAEGLQLPLPSAPQGDGVAAGVSTEAGTAGCRD